MSERSKRLAASEASLAEKVVRSTTDQLVLDIVTILAMSRGSHNIRYLLYLENKTNLAKGRSKEEPM